MRTDSEGRHQAIPDIAYAQPRYGIRCVGWWVRQQGFKTWRPRVRRNHREQAIVVRKGRRKRLKAMDDGACGSGQHEIPAQMVSKAQRVAS